MKITLKDFQETAVGELIKGLRLAKTGVRENEPQVSF